MYEENLTFDEKTSLLVSQSLYIFNDCEIKLISIVYFLLKYRYFISVDNLFFFQQVLNESLREHEEQQEVLRALSDETGQSSQS